MAKVTPLVYHGGQPPKNPDILKNVYLPSDELVEAINAALFLGNRPLLLKGEPGCGKTQVAAAVADELGFEYFRWDIKSTSRAKDGLYTFDAVRRLQDAQISVDDKELREKVANPLKYITHGPLGKAFKHSLKEPIKRPLILIDEIDKADIDFPNDLLLELDEQRFEIAEARRSEDDEDETDKQTTKEDSRHTVAANPNNRPVVFITSNDERDLPPAFLRRCLYFYVDFPNPDKLIHILNTRPAQEIEQKDNDLIKSAVERFNAYREEAKKVQGAKVPSTSELIDWVRLLHYEPTSAKNTLKKGDIPHEAALDKTGKIRETRKTKAKS